MKKLIEQHGAYFEPLIIISALIVAMLSQSQLSLVFIWLAFNIILGVALWHLRKPELYISLVKDKVFLTYSILILWAIISTIFWSQAKVNSILTIFTFSTGLLSYFVAYTSSDKQTLNTQKLLLILGLGLVFYTYYQFFVIEMARPESRRPAGLLLNWNTHAALLGMILVPWLLRYALNEKVINRAIILIGIITVLFAFAMGLTQSRGALMVLAISFVCLLIFMMRLRLSYKSFLFFLCAIALGYVLSSLFVSETMLQRISIATELESYTATDSGRQSLWLPAWKMYLDRPFLGWGLEAYASLFAKYKAPLTDEFGYYAHNDYLQLLVELGPVGLLLIVAFVFFIVQKLYFVMQKKGGESSTKREAFILLVPCLGLLTHTFFTFHLYQISMQMILGYYLGAAAKYVVIAKENNTDSIVRDSNIFFRFYRLILFVAIIFVIISGFTSYQIQRAESTNKYLEKLDHYLKASLFFNAINKYEALSAHYFTMRLEAMPKTDENTLPRQETANYILVSANTAIKKMPLQEDNYVLKANVLSEMGGEYSEICRQYETALSINPYLPEVRYHYAEFLEESGQGQRALEVLWDGWERLNSSFYQIAVEYLSFQLRMNSKYGEAEDKVVIESEISRIKQLMKDDAGGKYIFSKKKAL